MIAFECQPEQVEFVQHLITNVALLANENRDIPDATGQAETFISYEAFASTRPVTSCDELFLVEVTQFQCFSMEKISNLILKY